MNDVFFITTDLETGGINGNIGEGRIGSVFYPILEIAMLISDVNLTPVSESLRIVIHHDECVLDTMHEWAKDKHERSGLLDEVRNSTVSLEEAEKACIDYLTSHGVKPFDFVAKHGSFMVGNSVYFDKSFINAQMPLLDQYFSYQLVDVSVLGVMSRFWKPELRAMVKKQYNHRALDDINETIEELKVYKTALF